MLPENKKKKKKGRAREREREKMEGQDVATIRQVMGSI